MAQVGMASYYQHRDQYHHYSDGGTVYTTLDTETTRNILTTVFTVLCHSIGIVGAFFLRWLNWHRLKREKEGERTVPLTHLTSWMSLDAALKYLWDTVRLPGGICGLFMLLAGALVVAHPYFVNSFILTSSLQDQCGFEYGIYTKANSRPLVPSSTFSTAQTVYNAQYQVWMNGGFFGIYKLVNDTTPTIKPTRDDVRGWWLCTMHEPSTITWADWQSSDALVSFLNKQNFLYTEAQAISGSIDTADGSVRGFLVWSADQPNESLEQWDVRASVATNLSDYFTPSTAAASVTNLNCALEKTDASWTPAPMPSNRSLSEWVGITYGNLMLAPSSDYYDFYVRWMLNSMVMVASGGNHVTSARDLPAGESRTFGCSVKGTKILPEIWAILAAILLIFVPLLLADIVLLLVHLLKKSPVPQDDLALMIVAPAAPASVQEWQVGLATQMTEDKIRKKDLRNYSYKWDAIKKAYVVAKNTDVKPSAAVSEGAVSEGSSPITHGVSTVGGCFSVCVQASGT